MIVGLSLLVMLSALDASARGSAAVRNGSVRSSSSGFHGGARASVRGGLAKSAAQGNVSVRSGYRGGGNRNYSGSNHRYYHGYYGRGSHWPYWPIGSCFYYLPDYYTTVYVDGTPYYYCDGSYFMPFSNGYQVVPAPAPAPSEDQEATAQAPSDEQPIAAQPKSVSGDTTTINVPTSKEGFAPVRLVKHKNGYIGPQGEFYPGHPTVSALKALYGD